MEFCLISTVIILAIVLLFTMSAYNELKRNNSDFVSKYKLITKSERLVKILVYIIPIVNIIAILMLLGSELIDDHNVVYSSMYNSVYGHNRY